MSLFNVWRPTAKFEVKTYLRFVERGLNIGETETTES